MGIKGFFEKNGAKFSEVLNKIVPFFVQLSPHLLFATAVIASGGAPGAVSIFLGSFGEKIVEKALIDYPVNQILNKITGEESLKLSKEEIGKLKNAIESLCEKFEEASKQNIGFDKQVLQFIDALISSEEFKNLEQSIEDLNSKLEVLRGELSECLDNIEEEIEILSTVNLPKALAVLEKDALKPPEFFRSAGPLWVDFEKGYIYERPEVDEIIKEVEQKSIVVIKGNPASGKSVILRNIGYKLSNCGRDVYLVKLRGSESWQAMEIFKVRHGYILLEDAHLNVDFVENLLSNELSVKVVISSRDINLDKIYGPTSGYKFSEYLNNAKEIKARDAAYEIIKKFEDKKGKIPLEVLNKLTKNNLWITAWQLKSYEKYNVIDEDKVLGTVKDYIERLRCGGAEANALLPIAAFYSYEIPPRKPFVNEFVDTETIIKLERLNEISIFTSDGKDYTALYHSEMADIYIKVFEKFDDFGRVAKIKIRDFYRATFQNAENKQEWLREIFSVYLKKYPEELINVLYKLSLSSKFWRSNEIFSEKELLNTIYIRNLDEITKCFERKKYDDKMGALLRLLSWKDIKIFTKIVDLIDVSNLTADIESAGNIGEANSLIFRLMMKSGSKFASIILNKINIENLVDLANKDCDYKYISYLSALIENININKNFANRFLEKLNAKSLAEKLDKEDDISGINILFKKIYKIDKNIAADILKQMDTEKFKQKIIKLQDIWLILYFTDELAKIDKSTAKLISGMIDCISLIERINKERDIWEIKRFISKTARLNMSVALKVIKSDKLDIKHIVDGINYEYNIWKIKRLLNEVLKVDKNIAGIIVDRIDEHILIRKIDKEKDIRKIAGLISEVTNANENVAKIIIEGIDKQVLIKKIDEEENIRAIRKLIKAIRNVDEENSSLILNAVEKKKREEVL